MVRERTHETGATRPGGRRLAVLRDVCRHTPPHLRVEQLHFFDHPLDSLMDDRPAGHLVVEIRGSIRRGGHTGEKILKHFLHNLTRDHQSGGMTLVHKINTD